MSMTARSGRPSSGSCSAPRRKTRTRRRAGTRRRPGKPRSAPTQLWREHVCCSTAGAHEAQIGAERLLSSSGLTDDQAQVACGVLTSGRTIDILVGAAGSGKTRGPYRSSPLSGATPVGRVQRFDQAWESEVSLRLRAGDADVIAKYHARVGSWTAPARRWRGHAPSAAR